MKLACANMCGGWIVKLYVEPPSVNCCFVPVFSITHVNPGGRSCVSLNGVNKKGRLVLADLNIFDQVCYYISRHPLARL